MENPFETIAKLEASNRLLGIQVVEAERIGAQFERLLNLLPVGVSVIQDDRFVLVNLVMAQMLGLLTPAHAVGIAIASVTVPEEQTLGQQQWIPMAISGNTILFEERQFLRPDGTRLNVEVSGIATEFDDHPAILLVAIDLTERKRSMEMLRESEQRFSQMLKNVQLIAVGVDIQGNIIFCTDTFFKLTGWQREDIIGRSWFRTFLPSERQEEIKQTFLEMIQSNTLPSHFETEIQTRTGEQRLISWNNTPLHDFQGNIIGLTSVGEDITERKSTEDKIRHLAYYDILTSLPNRILFQDRLTAALVQAQSNEQMLAVMFLDLDRFQNVNVTLGHVVGDQLLQNVAKRLTSSLHKGEIAARLGGDEFALLLPQINGTEDAVTATQKIFEALESPFYFEGHELHITPSIGIALYPNDGENAQTLIKNAETAMHRAKAQGRNNYQFNTSTMNAKALERLVLESGLRRALERQELVIYYQPQVKINTKQIIGTEALVRWQHPDLGLISPAKFIPLAEETGLIIPLGEWVLRTACAQNKAWQDAGFPPLRISVNLSARQFQQQNLVETIDRILKETGLDPRYLELEITESIAMQNAEFTLRTLHTLKDMGIRISLDDFGTDYSSLSYLKHFPIHALKIDQSFVHEISTSSYNAMIINMMIVLAHNMKLHIIAEGVETEEQLNFLKQLQCDEMQGYLFSKPIPAEDIEVLFKQKKDLQNN